MEQVKTQEGWYKSPNERQGSGGRGKRGSDGTVQGTPGRILQGRGGVGPGGATQALSVRLNKMMVQIKRMSRSFSKTKCVVVSARAKAALIELGCHQAGLASTAPSALRLSSARSSSS